MEEKAWMTLEWDIIFLVGLKWVLRIYAIAH